MILQLSVWGKTYASTYLNTVLPSHLAAGNIECLGKNEEYRINTDQKTSKLLKRHINFKALKKKTNLILIISKKKNLSWNDMTRFHAETLKYSVKIKQGCVFLGPDFIISPNTISFIKEQERQNKDLILCPGIRTVKETTEQVIKRRLMKNANPISNNELAKICLMNLHPITKSLDIKSNRFTTFPSMILHRQNRPQIQALHSHPIYVKTKAFKNQKFDSIDGSFLSQFENKLRQTKIVASSNEMLLAELSSKKNNLGLPSTKNYFRKSCLYKFAVTRCNGVHIARFHKPYYIDTGDAFHAFAGKNIVQLHSLVLSLYKITLIITKQIRELSERFKSEISRNFILKTSRISKLKRINAKDDNDWGIFQKNQFLPFLRLTTNFNINSEVSLFSLSKKSSKKSRTKISWLLIKETVKNNLQKICEKQIKDILSKKSNSRVKKLSIIFVRRTSPFSTIFNDKIKLLVLKYFTSAFSEIIISKSSKNILKTTRLSLMKCLIEDFEKSGKIPICLKKIY